MINNILHILICFMCDFFNLCVGSIFRDSPYYAAAFVKEVRKAARFLTYFPKEEGLYQKVEEHIREIYVKSYRLIYQVKLIRFLFWP